MTEKEWKELIERDGSVIMETAGFCRRPEICRVMETEYFTIENDTALFCALIDMDGRYLFRVQGIGHSGRLKYTSVKYIGMEV